MVRHREIFEIKRGILPRAPTNVKGTEFLVRDREIFEIEGRVVEIERFYCSAFLEEYNLLVLF